MNNKFRILLFLLVSGIYLFCTLNIHSRASRFNYHSEIFADKAGYYIYLPSFFLFDFDVKQFPDSIEHKTGQGFAFNHQTNKISTKYPYGVAVLESPFFLIAHGYELLTAGEADGFTRSYHYSIDIAAVFYLLLGLIFLYFFLLNYFKERVVIIALLFLLFGTNLFYYTVQESGLSHVYSFFLFSLFAFRWKKYIDGDTRFVNYIYLGIIAGLIIAVRPINAVFIPFFLLLDIKSFQDVLNRIKSGGWNWVIPILLVVLFFVPQLLYYSYLYNSPIAYSYGEESFIYKFNPQFHRVFITLENGLLIYNPIHVFTLIGMYLMIRNKVENAWLPFLLFFGIAWLYASWHSPILGCGFGNRGFVEFYVLLIFPLAFFIEKILKMKSKSWMKILFGIMIVFSLYNLKMSYSYDGCWFGEGIWDFDEYFDLLGKW